MNRGEILREKRREKGCTQAETAKALDVSLRSYVSYEQNKEPRDKMFWTKAAKFFDCDVEDFGMSIAEDDAFESLLQGMSKSSLLKTGLAALSGVSGTALAASAFGPAGAVAYTALLTASGSIGYLRGRTQGMRGRRAERDEALQQQLERRHRFIRAAEGLIYSALIRCGIQPIPENPPEDETVPWPDEVLSVDSGRIKSWWLCYEDGVVDQEDTQATLSNEFRAIELLARFWDFAPDSTRKASVVVEDEKLFEALVAKRSGAYRGNLSAILIDTEDARLLREEYLATYEEGADESTLMRVV